MEIRAPYGATPLAAMAQRGQRRARQIAELLRRCWDAYWSWRARRMTLNILRTLDDRTLKDIGLSASEIASAVYGREDHRRRCYDENWWR